MSPTEPLRCSECGALLGTNDGFCWICCRPLSGPPPAGAQPKPPPASPVQLPAPLPPPEEPRARGDQNFVSSLSPLTLAIIVIGALAVFPPLGFVLGLCLLPAFLSVYSRAEKKRDHPEGPKDMSFGARVERIVTQVLVGFAIFMMVVLVIIVALFCVCMFMLVGWHK